MSDRAEAPKVQEELVPQDSVPQGQHGMAQAAVDAMNDLVRRTNWLPETPRDIAFNTQDLYGQQDKTHGRSDAIPKQDLGVEKKGPLTGDNPDSHRRGVDPKTADRLNDLLKNADTTGLRIPLSQKERDKVMLDLNLLLGRTDAEEAAISPERAAEIEKAKELAETNLKPSLDALAKGDMAKLAEIAAGLKNNDDALGQLQKMIEKKTGVSVSFGGSGIELTVSKQFPEAAPGTVVADGITQSTSVKFDKAGKPVSAEQTVYGGEAGGSKTKEMDVAEAQKVIQEALNKSLKK